MSRILRGRSQCHGGHLPLCGGGPGSDHDNFFRPGGGQEGGVREHGQSVHIGGRQPSIKACPWPRSAAGTQGFFNENILK